VSGGKRKALRAYISTMGCPKNLVDSEAAAAVLFRAGCELTEEPSEADVMLVGACSFLSSSWHETVEEVERLAAFKNGSGGRLVLMGCLPVHRHIDLEGELPEVDHFVPTGAHERLEELVRLWRAGGRGEAGSGPRLIDGAGTNRFAAFVDRPLSSPPHTAYVKIAEGCNRRCSFCAIPMIRGRQAVRPIADVVREVEGMVERGVREVTLLSQDIVSYREGGRGFTDLVGEVAGTGMDWIRLFYLHPAGLSVERVRRLFEHDSVVRYLEMPIQHVSNPLLARMRRSHDRAHVERVIAGIRAEFPETVIRSEVIVGFPGETDAHFEELLRCVSDLKFDSMGVFPYSPEPGTEAAGMPGAIPEAVVRHRVEELTVAQEAVSFGVQAARVGKSLDVLVDRRCGPDERPLGAFAGRFYGQAPEIDGEVFVETETAEVGEFLSVRITDSGLFDLEGEPAARPSGG
jgi:ribosomal protein S12 methylthiotransferase